MIDLVIQIIDQNLQGVILIVFIWTLPPKHGLIILILIDKIKSCRLLDCADITYTAVLHIS